MDGLKIKTVIRISFVLALFLSVGMAFAQLQTYNHPELEWRTIETEHFYVHFHQGTDRTASLVATIAEDVYGPLVELYDYEPDGKIHFIVRDHDDYSNGIAFYYDNKVDIWAPAMDFPLRGTHNWLRDVVTHELSHMISLGAARKMPRQIPAVYLQWFDYEKEKRPDVMYGYPKTLVSTPLAGTVMPMWFAEGMAQTQRIDLGYDHWDTHRDMLLRTAVLEDALLSMDEMNIFSKNTLGSERVYNQGYALTRFIAHRYGEDRLNNLTRAMKKFSRMTFGGAIREALGMSEADLYAEWVEWLREGYRSGTSLLQDHLSVPRLLDAAGMGNFHPVFSPDGNRIAYLSDRNRDYMSQTRLFILDLESGKRRRIKGRIESSLSWSPDGKKLVYAKRTDHTRQGSHYFDLYVYDLDQRKEQRITKSMRARQPDWSKDQDRIVCVIEKDGTSNLATVDPDGSDFQVITTFSKGERVYAPRWMDGGRIVFSIAADVGRDIAAVESDGSDFRYWVHTDADERDPYPGPDGQSLYYSSDRTGIFNIYRLDIISGAVLQLTNVEGGVFMPTADSNGRMAYSHFQADGYKLAMMDHPEPVDPEKTVYVTPYAPMKQTHHEKWAISAYNDRRWKTYESRPYKPIFAKLMFFPRVMMDYPQTPKIGAYFYGNDFLDKISVFGGAALNHKLDTDIFGIFEYRRFYPTLFVEAFQQSRHTKDGNVDVAFNLMEVDIGADWTFADDHRFRTVFVYDRYHARLTIRDQGQIIHFPYTYHIGTALRLHYDYRKIASTLISGIGPRHGRVVSLRAQRAWNQYLDGFDMNSSVIVELYKKYNYEQFEADWREYIPSPIKGHSFALRLHGGLVDQPVDSFYHLFGGGLDGLKGYPYYSIEGRKLFQASLAYRFPIFKRMGRLGFLYFDKLFLSVYGEVGKAWEGEEASVGAWRRSAGVQLRMSLISFYSFPMSLFVDAAYGLDRFTHREQIYGQELRTYFGILFDFLD